MAVTGRATDEAGQTRPRIPGPHTIDGVHEKRIEIRWRDVDAFRHVNNAVYATYLEECRDELAEQVLEGVGDPWDFVLARVAINYRRELIQADDIIVVGCAVDRVGNSSVTLREEIRPLAG